ncbi:MAG: CDP-diacylglycerol--serine O-phosphatidyltransferase [Elusimicrobiales bacterium]|jgi:CDP-diacylglycerol--serine O-phosphatidyltransferase|nr:CDP-diacylglycerol--serine O-phosphatidyltransferase [Elusimicrobiales bacterium]NLH38704.1 CDP-diacylglycerol--serine O-phosphatidyltransferase [Elusimicrobiota bacterium]
MEEEIKKIDSIKNKTKNAIPSIFTLSNMACGLMSILSVSNNQYITACYFIIGSYIMDILDGRVARFIGAETDIGVELDSFSDWISFGIAPAYMMYEFALKAYGIVAYPVVLIYVICGALRLARFNLKSLSGQSSKTFFQGLPIPAAAGILIFFVLSYSIIEGDTSSKAISLLSAQMPFLYSIIPFIIIGISLLMVSTVPYVAMKSNTMFRVRSPLGIIISVSLIFLIFFYPQNALFVFFLLYAISGIVYFFYRLFSSKNSSF